MDRKNVMRRRIAAGAILVGLGTACSSPFAGVDSSIPDSGNYASSPQATGGSRLFVADIDRGYVSIFASRKLVAHIYDYGLQGVAVDKNANLYVAGTLTGGGNGVEVFAPPYTATPFETIPIQGVPSGVATNRSGNLAILRGQGNSQTPEVQLYAPGSTTPCAEVTGTDFADLSAFAAFDAKGNLYVNGFDSDNVRHIGEVSGGCKATTITDLKLADLVDPEGIQIDNHGNIDIQDNTPSGYGTVINIYPPGATMPTSSVTLQHSQKSYCCGYGGFTFVDKGSAIWSATADQQVLKYAFPAGGAAISTITLQGGSNIAWSVAAFPPVWPGKN